MPEDVLLVKLERRRWITDGPLNDVVDRFVEYFRSHRYSSFTIQGYLKAIAHFSRWMTTKGFGIENIDEELIDYFVRFHLPHCKCPAPRSRDVAYVRSGLRHLRTILKQDGLIDTERPTTRIEKELERFQHFLLNVKGLAQNTCKSRLSIVSKFLSRNFETREIDVNTLRIEDIDAFVMDYAERWKPSSLVIVRCSLRSYFKFRLMLGDQTDSLTAALPNIAPYWSRAAIPTFLSSAELQSFLQAFDQSYPTGLRDYAIARCMIDLGLRGQEVAQLCFESFDWRDGTITISRTKSRRTYRLPLPQETGKAVVQYLRKGRPSSSSRAMFARHVAPYDKPLTKKAISAAMTQAFVRCGLFKFTGTHVLRRTLAVRLQQSGVSLKEIADVLRHKDLSTTQVYTRVDVSALRTVALPWTGRKS
jgi:integrase/recombinase XerD